VFPGFTRERPLWNAPADPAPGHFFLPRAMRHVGKRRFQHLPSVVTPLACLSRQQSHPEMQLKIV